MVVMLLLALLTCVIGQSLIPDAPEWIAHPPLHLTSGRRLQACSDAACVGSCHTNVDQSYGICTTCATGYKKQPDVDSCLTTCPSPGDATGGNWDALSDGITSFVTFGHQNVDTLQAQLGLGTYTATGTIPAPYRGLYFNGANSTAELSGVVIHTNLQIQVWSFREAASGSGTLFSLPSSTPSNNPSSLTLRIEQVNARNAKASFSFNTINIQTSNFKPHKWRLVSVMMSWTNGTDTDDPIYQAEIGFDGSVEATDTSSDWVPYHDANDGHHFGSDGTSDYFTGFIWSIKIYNTSRAIDANDYTTGQCYQPSQTWWECMFDEYYDGTICQPCTEDCAEGPCTWGGSCDLCQDKECNSWDVFNDINDCTDCTKTGNAEGDGSSALPCSCSIGYSRVNANDNNLCLKCPQGCSSTTGDQCTGEGYNYQDCTACRSSHYQYAWDESTPKYICTSYCPTGFVSTGRPNCTIGSHDPPVIFQKAFDNFDTQWSFTIPDSSTPTIATSLGTIPAFQRGQYFNGQSHISLSQYSLAPDFTIETYIRMDSFSEEQTIFQKDRGEAEDTSVFRLFLPGGNTANIHVELRHRSDWTTASTVTADGNQNLQIAEWAHVGISVELRTNGNTTNVCFYRQKSDVIAENCRQTVETSIYEDTEVGYDSYIGAHRHGRGDNFTGYLDGFVYGFYILNSDTPSGIRWGASSACSGCSDSLCSPERDYCLLNQDIGNDPDGNSCDESCGSLGCRRSGVCHDCADGVTYCRLCFDRECVNWFSYAQDAWAADSCTSHSHAAETAGQCICPTNYSRDNPDLVWVSNCLDSKCADPCHNTESQSYGICSSCSEGYKKQPDVDSCLQTCPSPGASSGNIWDPLPETPVSQVSFAHSNSAVFEASEGQGTYSANETVPTPFRGIYFNGAGSTVILSGVTLHTNLQVQVWMFPYASGTLFSLQSSTPTLSPSALTLSIQTVTDNTSKANFTFYNIQAETSAFATKEWKLVHVVMEWTNGSDTEAPVYQTTIAIDVSQTAIASFNDWVPYHDANTFHIFGNNGDGDSYQGFIYSISIYNVARAIAQSDYDDGICNTSPATCWVCLFDQYYDGSGCHPCNDSCAEGPCAWSNSCSLCQDKECAQWSVFNDTNNCTDCSVTGNAVNDDDALSPCDCKSGYGRVNADDSNLCVLWPEGCDITSETQCIGGQYDYQDCTACLSTHYQYAWDENPFLYACISYCPTGYTSSGRPNCTLGDLDPPVIFQMTFDNFESTWSYTNAGISTTATGHNTLPAFQRGQYFSGSSYISLSAYSLAPDFAMETFVRFDLLSEEQSLFQKDRGEVEDTSIFRVFLSGGTGTRIKVELCHRSDWTAVSTVTADWEVAEKQWTHLGVRAELSTNGNETIIHIYGQNSNASNNYSTTVQGIIYEDSEAGYNSYLGAHRSDTMTGYLKGFVYGLYIDNSHNSSGIKWGVAGTCSDCTNSICSNENDNCLLNQDIENDPDGNPCDATCAGLGCRRSGICHECASDFTNCRLCYDRECVKCTNYAENGCNADSCTSYKHATHEDGRCSCNDGYSRISDDFVCMQCSNNCANCELTENNYQQCTTCEEGAKNFAIQDATFKYCASSCPTNFNDDAQLGQCKMEAGKDHIASFNFNAPKKTHISTLDNNVINLTMTDDISVAKNRGLYFSGTGENKGQISGVQFGYSWTVHVWLFKLDNVNMAVFTKGDSEADNLHIQCIVNQDSQMEMSLMSTYAISETRVIHDNTLSNHTWHYLVYTASMSDGDKITVELFLDNLNERIEIWPFAVIDDASYEIFVGVTKEASTWQEKFNGYIYDLNIYQNSYYSQNIHFVTCPDTANCHAGNCPTADTWLWSIDYNQYYNDADEVKQCDGDCTCVSPGHCENCEVWAEGYFCNLCPDAECTACETFDQCSDAAWGDNASVTGSGCSCNEFFTDRISVFDCCEPCYGNWAACETSSDYSDCRRCSGDGIFGIPFSESYVYCTDFCPTHFTANSPSCVSPSNKVLFEQSFENFPKTWENGGISLTPVNVYPAFKRGQYFASSTDNQTAYMYFEPDFTLSLAFTISVWIRADSVDRSQTIFSKFEGTSFDHILTTVITETGNLAIGICKPAEANSLQLFQSNVKILEKSWVFMIYSIKLDEETLSDAILNFDINGDKVDDLISTKDTTSGYYFIDNATPYKALIGAQKTGSDVYTNEFHGFMYGLYIDDGFISGTSSPHYPGQSSCTSLGSSAAFSSSNCLDNYDFDSFSGGKCDETCSDRGCVRAGECQSADVWDDQYCHLCYDVECTNCDGYGTRDCQSGKCSVSGAAENVSGSCQCGDLALRLTETELCSCISGAQQVAGSPCTCNDPFVQNSTPLLYCENCESPQSVDCWTCDEEGYTCIDPTQLYLQQGDLAGIACNEAGLVISFNVDMGYRPTECQQVLHTITSQTLGNHDSTQGTASTCIWNGNREVFVQFGKNHTFDASSARVILNTYTLRRAQGETNDNTIVDVWGTADCDQLKPQAVITGPNQVACGGTTTQISGDYSTIEDGSILEYRWTGIGVPDSATNFSSDNKVITVTVIAETSSEFKLWVKSPFSLESEPASHEVSNLSSSDLTVVVSGPVYFATSDRVEFKANVLNCSSDRSELNGLEYDWELSPQDLGTTNSYNHYIISADTLTADTNYTIQVTVISSEGTRSTASLKLIVVEASQEPEAGSENNPPLFGSIDYTPKTIVKNKTQVAIWASGWIDPDNNGALYYEFWKDDEQWTLSSTIPSISIILAQNTSISVRVCDAFGACSRSQAISITVSGSEKLSCSDYCDELSIFTENTPMLAEQFAEDLLSDESASNNQCYQCSVNQLCEWLKSQDFQGEEEQYLFFKNYKQTVKSYGSTRLSSSSTLQTISNILNTLQDSEVLLSKTNSKEIMAIYDASAITQSIAADMQAAVNEICQILMQGNTLVPQAFEEQLEKLSYSFSKISTGADSIQLNMGNTQIDIEDGQSLGTQDGSVVNEVQVCLSRIITAKDSDNTQSRLSYSQLPDTRKICTKDPISINPRLTDSQAQPLEFLSRVNITVSDEAIPNNCIVGTVMYYNSTSGNYTIDNDLVSTQEQSIDANVTGRNLNTQDIRIQTSVNAPIFILFDDVKRVYDSTPRIYPQISSLPLPENKCDTDRYDSPFFVSAIALIGSLIFGIIIMCQLHYRIKSGSEIRQQLLISREDFLKNFKRLHLWISIVKSVSLKLPSLLVLLTYINLINLGVGLAIMTTGQASNSDNASVDSILSQTFEGFGLLVLVSAWVFDAFLSFHLWLMILKGDDKVTKKIWAMLICNNVLAGSICLVLTGYICGEAMQLWSSIILITLVFDALVIQLLLGFWKYRKVTEKSEKIDDELELIRDFNFAMEEEE